MNKVELLHDRVGKDLRDDINQPDLTSQLIPVRPDNCDTFAAEPNSPGCRSDTTLPFIRDQGLNGSADRTPTNLTLAGNAQRVFKKQRISAPAFKFPHYLEPFRRWELFWEA
ncbi:MAG: hypothetical protein WD045_18035 [Pirellulaceae bacterium]